MLERNKASISDTGKPIRKYRAGGFVITIAVVLAIFTVAMFFFFQQSGWNGKRAAFEAFFCLFTVGMIASCISRRAWVLVSRMGAACVFLIYFYYFIDESLFSGQAMRVSSFSKPSPYASLLGLLFWGVPCLLYALWGSQWGRIGVVPREQWSRRDIVVARISFLARCLFLVLLFVAMLWELATYLHR